MRGGGGATPNEMLSVNWYRLRTIAAAAEEAASGGLARGSGASGKGQRRRRWRDLHPAHARTVLLVISPPKGLLTSTDSLCCSPIS